LLTKILSLAGLQLGLANVGDAGEHFGEAGSRRLGGGACWFFTDKDILKKL